ncbi:MAG: hypothetical protein Q8R07_02780 [Candidatus Uhrbacteria bacterium]|nr:hypothetical protein [Candidatus Uhrbacteria bacterium]
MQIRSCNRDSARDAREKLEKERREAKASPAPPADPLPKKAAPPSLPPDPPGKPDPLDPKKFEKTAQQFWQFWTAFKQVASDWVTASTKVPEKLAEKEKKHEADMARTEKNKKEFGRLQKEGDDLAKLAKKKSINLPWALPGLQRMYERCKEDGLEAYLPDLKMQDDFLSALTTYTDHCKLTYQKAASQPSKPPTPRVTVPQPDPQPIAIYRPPQSSEPPAQYQYNAYVYNNMGWVPLYVYIPLSVPTIWYGNAQYTWWGNYQYYWNGLYWVRCVPPTTFHTSWRHRWPHHHHGVWHW